MRIKSTNEVKLSGELRYPKMFTNTRRVSGNCWKERNFQSWISATNRKANPKEMGWRKNLRNWRRWRWQKREILHNFPISVHEWKAPSGTHVQSVQMRSTSQGIDTLKKDHFWPERLLFFCSLPYVIIGWKVKASYSRSVSIVRECQLKHVPIN